MLKINRNNLRPVRTLNLLSSRELQGLMSSNDQVRRLFRQCALAVLNAGSDQDDIEALLESYSDFDITVSPQSRGPILSVQNAPASAFVDGNMIRATQEHLFSVLRDIVFVNHSLSGAYDLDSRRGITDAVFDILRNADIVRPNLRPDLVICWGGHSICRAEYDYTKEVGYQLGLRGLNIGTGCGPGAMKGPMKGAAIGHSKQQQEIRRYIGISEPGIIAAEAPNPIVNELVILPDIEKRLEAFVRLAHCIVVFPGGAGTAEELLYLLSILAHERNADHPFGLILSAPEQSHDYFEAIDAFIRETLGHAATAHYEIVIGDVEETARRAKHHVIQCRKQRMKSKAAYSFNWELYIPAELQEPFQPTHENMAAIKLHTDQPAFDLASNLRKAFSGIVSGNVKPFGIEQIRQQGPYLMTGEKKIMQLLQGLLDSFVTQRRMKLNYESYEACWRFR
ncbi:MAG: nucleotide 5'-monophosphate nucleosidase PpnN [Gammaproteobacteria bacterium]|nr:nucleotide 5'-monophosphate nucleosidase PpnN [Gammaproteobacteria bacterium]MCY4358517.1 nucleotide 5'-monophosphate nucleosidase PpnN [Gammaproteobacteria bacterium]